MRRAKGEAVGGKVGVDAIEPARSDVLLVALFHDEAHKNAIVRGPSDAVRAFGCQELGPGLWRRQVGVIDIKERQNLTRAGLESVEGSVLSVPGKSGKFKLSSGLIIDDRPVSIT